MLITDTVNEMEMFLALFLLVTSCWLHTCATCRKMPLSINNLPIITDFDGTIAFYLSSESKISENHIALPLSSSGLEAFTSKMIVSCLSKLCLDHTIICASGMRESTMRSRFEYFPMIDFWICENGGKIFSVSKRGSQTHLVENQEWKNLLSQKSDASLFSEFKEFVKKSFCSSPSGPLTMDDEGYSAMFRLKAKNRFVGNPFTEVQKLIPDGLASTFNLGHLDVHLPLASKSSAVDWLLSQRITTPPEYIFIGDDDNDVEVASKAKLALIVKPRSSGMEDLIREFVGTGSSSRTIPDPDLSERINTYESGDGTRHLWVARQDVWGGTEALLQSLLQWER